MFFVIKVVSRREIADKAATEDRYYMSSLASSKIVEIAKGIQSHWVVENSLHYVVDVTFAQDSSRVVEKENAGERISYEPIAGRSCCTCWRIQAILRP